ncbi:hypothetical protein BaRGS_00000331, partial [Batillaria attramentaria]
FNQNSSGEGNQDASPVTVDGFVFRILEHFNKASPLTPGWEQFHFWKQFHFQTRTESERPSPRQISIQLSAVPFLPFGNACGDSKEALSPVRKRTHYTCKFESQFGNDFYAVPSSLCNSLSWDMGISPVEQTLTAVVRAHPTTDMAFMYKKFKKMVIPRRRKKPT